MHCDVNLVAIDVMKLHSLCIMLPAKDFKTLDVEHCFLDGC